MVRTAIRRAGFSSNMSSPGESQRYMPALDGLRAFAVLAVMAYHLNLGWAGGGYLGVDLFFVLSGFLITGLLLGEWSGTGGIGLRAFWGRRARRLLPAVLLLLVALSVYGWLGGGVNGLDRSGLRGDSLATLFYVANWHFVFSHQSYFAQFAVPSPLRHTWSLAIEEQFYVVWPLLLLGILGAARHSRLAATRRALGITVVLGAASAALMALLYVPGGDPSRVYYGTDTRAFELLIGAALAILLARRRELSGLARRTLHGAGIASAIALGYWWTHISGTPGWMYRGGFVGASLLVAVIIASVSQVRSGPLGAVLSLRPVRWVGMISYGLYLWHWPVFVLVNDTDTGLSGNVLLALRVALTFAVATLSFYALERPIRRASFQGWRAWVAAPSGVAVTGMAVMLAALPVASTSAAAAPTASVSAPSASAGSRGAVTGRNQLGAVDAPLAFATPGGQALHLAPGRVISRQDPLNVLVIGDSVMQDSEPGLAAALEATGVVKVYDYSYPGWGLTRSDTWRTDWPKVISQYHIDLVIGMWSWDNPQAQNDPVGYAGLVNQALGVLLAPGNGVSGVAFLQFPKMGPIPFTDTNPAQRAAAEADRERGREAWNAVVAGLVPLWPGRVAFLPVASSLEIHGHYATWMPVGLGGTWLRVRKIDNVHMCPAGAARLGQSVLDQLTPSFGLPAAAPGWWAGAWNHDPRFQADQCPNDQPPAGYAASLS